MSNFDGSGIVNQSFSPPRRRLFVTLLCPFIAGLSRELSHEEADKRELVFYEVAVFGHV
jgi:hypothetical protein